MFGNRCVYCNVFSLMLRQKTLCQPSIFSNGFWLASTQKNYALLPTITPKLCRLLLKPWAVVLVLLSQFQLLSLTSGLTCGLTMHQDKWPRVHKAHQMFPNKNVFQPSMSCTNLYFSCGEYWGNIVWVQAPGIFASWYNCKKLYLLSYYLTDKSQLYFILY